MDLYWIFATATIALLGVIVVIINYVPNFLREQSFKDQFGCSPNFIEANPAAVAEMVRKRLDVLLDDLRGAQRHRDYLVSLSQEGLGDNSVLVEAMRVYEEKDKYLSWVIALAERFGIETKPIMAKLEDSVRFNQTYPRERQVEEFIPLSAS